MTVKNILKNLDGVNQEVFDPNSLKHHMTIDSTDAEELPEVITILSEKGYALVKDSGIINWKYVALSKEEALKMPSMKYSEEYIDVQGRAA